MVLLINVEGKDKRVNFQTDSLNDKQYTRAVTLGIEAMIARNELQIEKASNGITFQAVTTT